MKQSRLLLLGFLLSIFIISCSKDLLVEDSYKSQYNSENKVTNKSILTYANAKYGKTKGNSIKVDPICSNNDTLAYILNYGSGWELLSGDTRYTPVLAKGDGTYSIDNLNQGQKVWLESEMEVIQAIRNNDIVIPEDNREDNENFWARVNGPINNTKAEGDPIEGWELVEIREMGIVASRTSGHMIKTQWGQRHPWNQCVPNASTSIGGKCAAGCVAVAGAQMLKFIHDTLGKPNTFYTNGQCIGNEFSHTFLYSNPDASAWNNMATVISENSNKLFQSALLIAWVGDKVNMRYSQNDSRAYASDLPGVFKLVGVNCTFGNYNASTVFNELTSGWPVCVRALTSSGDGHTWIIDGYVVETYGYQYIYEYTEHGAPYNEYGEQRIDYDEETYRFVLMNWGENDVVDNNQYNYGVNTSWYPSHTSNIYFDGKQIIYNFN